MISPREVIDIIIMTAAVGFIFMGFFRQHLTKKNAFLFACLITAPALIFHELAHKFVAVAFGLSATFHAAYFWLIIGIVLRLLQFPFIFFIPGYVSIPSLQASPGASAIIAFAGPALNLVLFITATLVLKHKKKIKKNTFIFWHITKQINLFLFILNMLPIPPFDGSKVFSGIMHLFT